MIELDFHGFKRKTLKKTCTSYSLYYCGTFWDCNQKLENVDMFDQMLHVGLQFGMAGTFIITKACLDHGMSRFVLTVYRNVIAAVGLAPFALIFERPVIDQTFTCLGMQYTSASFASAIMNAVPSVTFVIAVILRLERVNLKELRSQAKVIGTLVTFAGALLMTLYKGSEINLFNHPNSTHHESHSQQGHKNWVTGTLFLCLGCLAWSSFYILQMFCMSKNTLILKEAKHECKKLMNDNPMKSLHMIDIIQRLGNEHHFEEEIEVALQKQQLILSNHANEFVNALAFRLLRQGGHYVSAESMVDSVDNQPYRLQIEEEKSSPINHPFLSKMIKDIEMMKRDKMKNKKGIKEKKLGIPRKKNEVVSMKGRHVAPDALKDDVIDDTPLKGQLYTEDTLKQLVAMPANILLVALLFSPLKAFEYFADLRLLLAPFGAKTFRLTFHVDVELALDPLVSSASGTSRTARSPCRTHLVVTTLNFKKHDVVITISLEDVGRNEPIPFYSLQEKSRLSMEKSVNKHKNP
uniref:Auxin-induced protein 5NG4 n=1 Tax=Cajanus cajan TaxID=3821 RepID=A0A151TWG4_CAJCA|nr:Auxin-induced protein 5NG4 [Cajanus cajan]